MQTHAFRCSCPESCLGALLHIPRLTLDSCIDDLISSPFHINICHQRPGTSHAICWAAIKQLTHVSLRSALLGPRQHSAAPRSLTHLSRHHQTRLRNGSISIQPAWLPSCRTPPSTLLCPRHMARIRLDDTACCRRQPRCRQPCHLAISV